MTTGQANALILLNAVIRWSLLAMIIVLAVGIIQWTVYQPGVWKDPIGFMVIFLECCLLAEVAPQEYGQWFVHSVSGEIAIGFIAVILSMFVTLALAGRIIVWAVEWGKIKRRARTAKPPQEPSTPAS